MSALGKFKSLSSARQLLRHRELSGPAPQPCRYWQLVSNSVLKTMSVFCTSWAPMSAARRAGYAPISVRRLCDRGRQRTRSLVVGRGHSRVRIRPATPSRCRRFSNRTAHFRHISTAARSRRRPGLVAVHVQRLQQRSRQVGGERDVGRCRLWRYELSHTASDQHSRHQLPVTQILPADARLAGRAALLRRLTDALLLFRPAARPLAAALR